MNEMYFKSDELSNCITEKEIDFIARMFAELIRLGRDEEIARRMAVRIGMKIILAHRVNLEVVTSE